MRGGRCCSQGGRYAGPGMDGAKGSAMKGDMEAPGFTATDGPSTAHAVETKEKGEWSRRISKQD